MVYDVIIVGGGIGGMCAALRAAQNNLRTLVLLGNRQTAKASRVKYIYNLDNMMGLHPGLMREKYLSLFRDDEAARAKVAGARFHLETQYLVDDTLARLKDYSDKVHLVAKAAVGARRVEDAFEVSASDSAWLGKHVVLSTGVTDRQPAIRKRRGDRVVEGIQFVYPFANHESFLYCIRCEGHLTRKANCAVIGHSEAAAQNAMMLYERYGIEVFLLTHGEPLQASDDTVRLLDAYGIKRYESPIADIKGSDGGRVIHQLVLEDGTVLPARYAMVAMGLYRVFNELSLMLGVEHEPEGPVETRHVLIDAKGETTLPNVFAVGDMARRRDEPVMKQIYTSQEYAVRAIDAIDGRLRRARRAEILTSAAQRKR